MVAQWNKGKNEQFDEAVALMMKDFPNDMREFAASCLKSVPYQVCEYEKRHKETKKKQKKIKR